MCTYTTFIGYLRLGSTRVELQARVAWCMPLDAAKLFKAEKQIDNQFDTDGETGVVFHTYFDV